ncbi:MAG: response regulator transcription factor [Betaproteobacteria bacterium]|nr:response regulator transcription factor [Betaproteobacteria bacterium]
MIDPEAKVYVVDDDEAMRDSMQWLLESRGFAVECYGTAEEFLAAYTSDRPGCLLLDVRMPGMSGLELYERLRSRNYRLPVIFITGHGDVPMAVSALKKGAADFIEKPFNDQELADLVESSLQHDGEARQERRQQESASSRLCSLTPREKEVLGLVVAGKLNKQIADELGISIKTVEVHRGRIMEKAGAGSLAELVQLVVAAEGKQG